MAAAVPRPSWTSRLPALGCAAAVALTVFVVAYQSGGYGLSARSVLGVAIWWAVVLGLALGVWPRERVPREALVVAGSLAVFALFTLLSAAWAESAERALVELNRVALYLGLLVLALLAAGRRSIGAWRDGLAVGLTAVAAVALVSRFFPGSFGAQGLPEFLPAGATRLSFPVGYWNGLAVLVALALPLLLGLATSARAMVRAGAVGSIPLLAGVVVLSSSRGGALAAVVGASVFVAASSRRWAALAALAAGGAGSAVLALYLLRQDELLDGPLTSSAASSQGAGAALVTAVACFACGGVSAAGSEYGRGLRPPRGAGWAFAGVAALVAVVALVAVDPAERLADFREAPVPLTSEDPDFVATHLFGSSGSGRWQFWETALDEWESAPFVGRGAGSFGAWWAQHGSLPLVVKDAHSLYVETLAELGLVGLALLLVPLGAGTAVAVQRLRREQGERELLASVTASFAAFAVAAALDWLWEITAVAGVAFVLLGLMTGGATLATGGLRVVRERDGRVRPAYALGVATVGVGWLIATFQLLPLLADTQVRRSQAAAARGDGAAALDHARSASRIQPWSAVPRLQTALVRERLGDLAGARASAHGAIERDPENWTLWLVLARLETKAGDIPAARRALGRARALNPRSRLFGS